MVFSGGQHMMPLRPFMAASSRNLNMYLDADISKYFDRINHDALLGKVGQSPYRRLIKQWLKSGVFDNKQFLKLN